MDASQALVLGITQGFTEFLPISSSGHLVTLPWLFNWNDSGATFDVALHLGTLLSLTLYFWKDWIAIIKKWNEPLLWLIAIGCVPAAVFGFLFEKYFETVFRSPLVIAIFMIVMALLMWTAEIYGKRRKTLETLNLGDTLLIGFSQALALMPGVSRSGITITTGLALGFERAAAARFSFLLAMPITFGAGVLKFKHIVTHGIPANEYNGFVIGIIAAALAGFIAIKFLLKYLEKHSLYIFVWYRILFSLLVLGVYLARS